MDQHDKNNGSTEAAQQGSVRRRLLKAGAASAAMSTLGFPAIVRAQSSTLNVGVILPTSGVQALIGQSCKRGADIAPAVLAEMGYGGGIKLLHADTETNIDVARSRAEKLINDGANVLVGPFDSGAAGAIAQVAEQKGVPFIINIAAAPQLTEQGYKFTFRNFPTSVDLVRNGLALMRDLFQATATAPRTCVFMHVNDTFGQANRQRHRRHPADAELPAVQGRRDDLLRPGGEGPVGRGGEGEGDQRRLPACWCAGSTTPFCCAARWSSSAGIRWASSARATRACTRRSSTRPSASSRTTASRTCPGTTRRRR